MISQLITPLHTMFRHTNHHTMHLYIYAHIRLTSCSHSSSQRSFTYNLHVLVCVCVRVCAWRVCVCGVWVCWWAGGCVCGLLPEWLTCARRWWQGRPRGRVQGRCNGLSGLAAMFVLVACAIFLSRAVQSFVFHLRFVQYWNCYCYSLLFSLLLPPHWLFC